MIGVLNWLLGGIVCYGYDGIRIEQPGRPAKSNDSGDRKMPTLQEWHPASDFVLPGNRKSLLPPKY
jgi:hypothetical protein